VRLKIRCSLQRRATRKVQPGVFLILMLMILLHYCHASRLFTNLHSVNAPVYCKVSVLFGRWYIFVAFVDVSLFFMINCMLKVILCRFALLLIDFIEPMVYYFLYKYFFGLKFWHNFTLKSSFITISTLF